MSAPEGALQWRIHTSNLISEVLKNPGSGILHIPLSILGKLLAAVGERASDLNDPELNALMVRLTIYSVADPESPDYDPELVNKIISESALRNQQPGEALTDGLTAYDAPSDFNED